MTLGRLLMLDERYLLCVLIEGSSASYHAIHFSARLVTLKCQDTLNRFTHLYCVGTMDSIH